MLKVQNDDIVVDWISYSHGDWVTEARVILRNGEIYVTKNSSEFWMHSWKEDGVPDYYGDRLYPEDGARFLLGLLFRSGTYSRAILRKGSLEDVSKQAGKWKMKKEDWLKQRKKQKSGNK